MRHLSTAFLIATTLASLPILADQDRRDDRRDDREARNERRDHDREDRRYWKEHDDRERNYWREREGREHRVHSYYMEEERGREHRRQVAPPWMDNYWRSGETRRYVALVPGDPSRMYVFLDGRWVLRQVRDPRARLDLEGAFRLPLAPPPIAPPRIGLDLHVVLFN
jgi:hypothetical protein